MGGVGFVLIAPEIWGRERGNRTSRWRPPQVGTMSSRRLPYQKRSTLNDERAQGPTTAGL